MVKELKESTSSMTSVAAPTECFADSESHWRFWCSLNSFKWGTKALEVPAAPLLHLDWTLCQGAKGYIVKVDRKLYRNSRTCVIFMYIWMHLVLWRSFSVRCSGVIVVLRHMVKISNHRCRRATWSVSLPTFCPFCQRQCRKRGSDLSTMNERVQKHDLVIRRYLVETEKT